MTDSSSSSLNAIAIVGLAGRFPGARTLAEFWANLRDGVESITTFSDETLLAAGTPPELLHNPHYVKARALLADIEWFDAAFFGLNPREAQVMDPQHRLFLETAWEALEHAGHTPETFRGAIGIYGGASMNSYLLHLYANPEAIEAVGTFQTMLGNDKDFVPTRVSYKLNLKGPSVNVQTACSTSLVAVHLACQSLLSGECDMALAGGVSAGVPQQTGYLYHEGGINSPDGHCRAFDAQAQGTVGGSGVGLVVLRRLDDALADGDTIYAVIKGSAVNNDGARKVGYTAPSVEGQAAVIAEALALSNVDPESISYIEAHGTGTTLGDPIEVTALTRAFRESTDARHFCALGSVKTNIGHLDAAAGIAGLLKTVLALHHATLPPSLHYTQPNPQIDFQTSPFYVNDKLTPWPEQASPRRAGVSSFGIGGTNAHVILEEAPPPEPSGPSRPWHALCLSARTPAALEQASANLAAYLTQNPHSNLADVAFTLQIGRQAFAERRVVLAPTVADALAALNGNAPQQNLRGTYTRASGGGRPLAFLFSGQGAQYANMGRALYDAEPVFREQVDACAQRLLPHLGYDIRTVLYPTPPRESEASAQLEQTSLTQPALFTIEYALAQLWRHWGIQPQALLGHSIGEYVAACLAGVFTLDDALALVAARGRLVQSLPPGAMLALPLSPEALQPWLTDAVALAAINGPTLCVASGTPEAIAALEARLTAENVTGRRLHTSHAFHSAMLDPILPAFRALVAHVALHPPEIPLLSNVTGTWLTAAQATDPDYWVQHLRGTVRFSDGVQTLLADPERVLLEVGPGQTLAGLARRHPARTDAQLVLHSSRHPQETVSDYAILSNTLGRLWLAGVTPNWETFYADERRQRLPLPTYPFERQRHWVEPSAHVASPAVSGTPAPVVPTRVADPDHWFYTPTWQQTVPPQLPSTWAATPHTWLIFLDAAQLGSALALRLRAHGQHVITCTPRLAPPRLGPDDYALIPHTDFAAACAAMQAQQVVPAHVIYLWSVHAPGNSADIQLRAYTAAAALGAALQAWPDGPRHLTLISTGACAVTGHEHTHLTQATLLTLERSLPTLNVRMIDVEPSPTDAWQDERLADCLLAEVVAPDDARLSAYRGPRRWRHTFAPLTFAEPDATPQVRTHGVYVITHGLTGAGYLMAQHLARTAQAHLVLYEPDASTTMPQSAHDALTALGATVSIVHGTFVEALHTAHTLYGTLHGVLYRLHSIHADPFAPTPDAPADEQARTQHLLAVVAELETLSAALSAHTLDFCIVHAPLSALLGTPGTPISAPAYALVAAWAQAQQAARPGRWQCVNWEPWQAAGDPAGLTAAESTQSFARLLALEHVTQIALSRIPLLTRLAQRATASAPEPATAPPADSTALAPRPTQAVAYAAPVSAWEQRVAALWQNVLGIAQVGRHDNFFDLGGHSLLASQLMIQLREASGLDLPVRTLFEAPSVAALAAVIERLRADGESSGLAHVVAVDLRAEIALDASIEAAGRTAPHNPAPQQLLLTGPTGFLGAFLLHDLLRHSAATITCVVRATDAAQGHQRIRRNLETYQLWDDAFAARIVPALGDLTQPRLGLTPTAFATLAATIEVIYHCGAQVNFTYPYAALKPANVLGTQEVLRLATQGLLKPVHAVSTLAVFSVGAYPGVTHIPEDDALDDCSMVTNGYAQSKWVSEKLLALARARGVPVSIYRAGIVAGHSQTGACNTSDFMWRLLKGCIQLGAAPDLNLPLSLAPADYVSQAIVYLAAQAHSRNQAFHLFNPHTLDWNAFFEAARAFGYALPNTPYRAWRTQLRETIRTQPDNALLPFAAMFTDAEEQRASTDAPAPEPDAVQPTPDLQYDDQHTLAGLRDTAITCPPIDTATLQRYLSFFVKTGYLPAPRRPVV